jgi:hypothetical protein
MCRSPYKTSIILDAREWAEIGRLWRPSAVISPGWNAAEPPKVNLIVVLASVPPQPPAEYLDNDSYGKPEDSSVQRIPHRFLQGCHMCCTENDK